MLYIRLSAMNQNINIIISNYFVAFFISFQKIIPFKIPPRGGTGVIVAQRLQWDLVETSYYSSIQVLNIDVCRKLVGQLNIYCVFNNVQNLNFDRIFFSITIYFLLNLHKWVKLIMMLKNLFSFQKSDKNFLSNWGRQSVYGVFQCKIWSLKN